MGIPLCVPTEWAALAAFPSCLVRMLNPAGVTHLLTRRIGMPVRSGDGSGEESSSWEGSWELPEDPACGGRRRDEPGVPSGSGGVNRSVIAGGRPWPLELSSRESPATSRSERVGPFAA